MDEDELDVITEVFGQYMEIDDDDEGQSYLPTAKLADAMAALGLEETHIRTVTKTLDPGCTGRIDYEPFAEVMTLQLKDRASGDAQEAFELFTDGQVITIDDLRRISKTVVKDGASDEKLYEMLSLSDSKTSMNIDQFTKIMKQANAL